MENNKLIRYLLQLNKERHQAFISPDNTLWRRQYHHLHPTEIIALKCMDGRLNLSVMTKTPLGIIQPFRNIAGQFDLGWPFFGKLMDDSVEYAIRKGRDCLILVTYHFSKSDSHRGCRGFDYDVDAAKQYTLDLKKQFERVFGERHSTVYPVQLGIETDEDSLILHGESETLYLAEKTEIPEERLRWYLGNMWPDMKSTIQRDFMPLLIGNQSHIQEIRASHRPLTATQHSEQILAIGRGFDWLHLPNKALIIGPYSYNLEEPVETAARILLDNLQGNRIPNEDGVVLLTSAGYRNRTGPEPLLAREKSESLMRFARKIIQEKVPELMEHLYFLNGIVDLNSRLFTPQNHIDIAV